MASTTTNLGLTKPTTSEAADISVINTNMDLIDEAFGNIYAVYNNYGSTTYGTDDTVTIPDFSSAKAITIVARRYGYAATKTLPKVVISGGNALYLIFRDTTASGAVTQLSISTSGVVTVTSTTTAVILDFIIWY